MTRRDEETTTWGVVVWVLCIYLAAAMGMCGPQFGGWL